MKRFLAVLVAATILAGALSPATAVASDNEFIEVAKTTAYGALAGLLVGSAVGLLADDGEPVKWGFVIGTFGGLIYGVAHMDRSTASLMEIRDGHFATGGLAAIDAAPGAVKVRALGVRF